MSSQYVHGSTGAMYVGATSICLTGWDVDETADMADVSSTCSGGFHEQFPGLKSLTATLNAIWDINANPMLDPPKFYSGAELTNVKFAVTPTSYWLIPKAYVESFKATCDVNDVIKYTVSVKSSGPYTVPA